MENFADRYRGMAFAVLILGTLILAIVIVLPFLPALLWAVMLSILMYPLYRKIYAKLAGKKGPDKGVATIASSITTLITFLIICLPFVLVGVFLYVQISTMVRGLEGTGGQHNLDQVVQQLDSSVNAFFSRVGLPTIDLSTYARDHSSDIVRTIQQPVSHAFGKIAFTGLSLVIALLTMFFMLRDGHRLREPAKELLPLPPEKTDAILKKVGETVYAVFIGTVLVATIQAVMLGIGFKIAGLSNAFLFGIVALFLCTIPLVGATIIYLPAALILAVNGNYWGAIGIVILGLVVTKLDYLLRPLLIGGRTSLHPIGIFFGILGGVLVFGPVGLVAGPMVLAVLLALSDLVREKVRGTADDSSVTEVISASS